MANSAERMKRIRKERRDAGLCAQCGKNPSSGWRCSECSKKLNRTPGKKARVARSVAKVKADVFHAYGGKCACCDESEPLFLTIDHMNNDGADHRKTLRSGTAFYRWLRKNGYPKGFQILCWNCNSGRHLNGGVCPHHRALPS